MLDFMFLVFGGMAVLGALVLFGHPSIVHGAFALVLSLFGVAGLYWTLGADFLGAAQLLLYVGGVTVLLLFAVMLTTRDVARPQMGRYVIAGVLSGLLVPHLLRAGSALVAVVGGSDGALPDPQPTTESIGIALLTRDAFLLPFEAISLLLLMVLVGAVTLARRSPEEES